MKILPLFFLLFSTSLFAQDFKEDISPSIQDLFKKYNIDSSLLSYSLKRIDKEESSKGLKQDQLVIPASLTKILTAHYALKKLGEEHRFETTIESSSEIKDGVLKGDLILRGGGDPFFTNAMLINMAVKLKALKIKEISGNFIYDQSYIPYQNMISSIGLGDQTYNPGISALSLEFNRFSIWKGNRPIPNAKALKVMSVREKFTPGKRFKLLNGDSKSEVWALSTKEKYGVHEEVPIRNPALLFASTFQMICKKVGITLPNPIEKKINKEKILHTERSQPLKLLVKSVMEYSNNMMAELLLLSSSPGSSIQDSAEKLQKHLVQENPFLKGLSLKNGSGLDSKNRVSSRALTHFLASKFKSSYGMTTFPSLFSISGQSGWLLKRLNDPSMSYNVWAKTGSLDYIDNMAGYLFTKSGKIYAFSVFINDFKRRSILDGENSEKVNNLREKAKRWRKSTKPLTEEIIRQWYNIL
ncbi:MAG: D-alanyl-D-alanine carboxypeptidase [Bacteriovoracaceae bacterium]|nr:D-alanyl-D-alanine carboxypeptidase [Bacteriovoracaceae bacterium]